MITHVHDVYLYLLRLVPLNYIPAVTGRQAGTHHQFSSLLDAPQLHDSSIVFH